MQREAIRKAQINTQNLVENVPFLKKLKADAPVLVLGCEVRSPILEGVTAPKRHSIREALVAESLVTQSTPSYPAEEDIEDEKVPENKEALDQKLEQVFTADDVEKAFYTGTKLAQEKHKEQIANLEEEVKATHMRINKLNQLNEKLLIKLETIQRNNASAVTAANKEIQLKDMLTAVMTSNSELKTNNKRLLDEVAELKHELEQLKTNYEISNKEEEERYAWSTMVGCEVPKWAVVLMKDRKVRMSDTDDMQAVYDTGIFDPWLRATKSLHRSLRKALGDETVSEDSSSQDGSADECYTNSGTDVSETDGKQEQWEEDEVERCPGFMEFERENG